MSYEETKERFQLLIF